MLGFPSTWFVDDMYLDDFGCFVNQYLGFDIYQSFSNEKCVSRSAMSLWDNYTFVCEE